MYPKKMRWVDIYLMRSDLRRVIDRLHDSLMIEVRESGDRPEAHAQKEFIELKGRLDRMVEFLKPMDKRKKRLFSTIEDSGFQRIRPDPSDIRKLSTSWLKEAESRVKPLRSEMDRIGEDRAYIAEIKEKLTTLTGLDVDMLAISSLSRTIVKVGTTRRYRELAAEVGKVHAEVQGSLLDKKEGIHSVRIIYTRGNAEKVENILRGRLFSEINLDIPRFMEFVKRVGGSTKVLGYSVIHMIQELESMDDGLDKRHEELMSEGAALAVDLLYEAQAWREAVEIEIDKAAVSSSLKGTGYTNRISGFVEADRVPELRSMMTDLTADRFHIHERDPTKEEIDENKVPTKLNNGKFVRLFEPLTLTFSTPKYKEIDPSIWISIPFVAFFGLMLGDAGYGILLIIPSLYIYLKGKRSQTLRGIGALGLLLGISATIAGIWMGSFFGDLVPRLIFRTPSEPLFSLSLFGYDLPYDTLRDPMLLFQISLYIGLAQLNLGFLLLGYDRLKKKMVWGFVKGTVSWALVQVGAVIFIGAILVGWWELDTVLIIIGASAFLSGAVLLAFEVGIMFFFNIEGLLGDWISYTRILALGLSTFGLAMAFNIIGEMIIDIHPIFIPVVAILLALLHIFNLLLQTLGSSVHSLRLQFVEFFSKFFEGGGELFRPFGREREFTLGAGDTGAGGGPR
ncbi:MAG: V-type ATP synthase subunit I [Thermoplasmatota archaeon]